jgi:hypothetical protein
MAGAHHQIHHPAAPPHSHNFRVSGAAKDDGRFLGDGDGTTNPTRRFAGGSHVHVIQPPNQNHDFGHFGSVEERSAGWMPTDSEQQWYLSSRQKKETRKKRGKKRDSRNTRR